MQQNRNSFMKQFRKTTTTTFLMATLSCRLDVGSISTRSNNDSSWSRTSRARFIERCWMKFSKHHCVENPVSTHCSHNNQSQRRKSCLHPLQPQQPITASKILSPPTAATTTSSTVTRVPVADLELFRGATSCNKSLYAPPNGLWHRNGN